MNLFTQAIFSGLTAGAVYALLAVGLVIAYRTTRVVNLAHGESYAIAGTVISLLDRAQVPLPLAMAAGIAAAAWCLHARVHADSEEAELGVAQGGARAADEWH